MTASAAPPRPAGFFSLWKPAPDIPWGTLSLHNTLWLVFSLGLAAIPHVERLPVWLSLVAGACLLWRITIAAQGLRLPRRWLLFLLVTAFAVGVYLNYRTLFGRDAGVALLVAMVALKLLETARLRDAMVLLCLGYFLVITNFLYTQTIPIGAHMLAAVLVITVAMVTLQYASARPDPKTSIRLAAFYLLQAAPLMAILFVLFPRIQGPLWGLPQDAYSGVTGLSDTMSPGSLSRLTLSDAVAFRVKFHTPLPQLPQLYWRGPVLWEFDGRTWSAGFPARPTLTELQPIGDPIRYAVTLEPHNFRWLFALDLPIQLPPKSRVTGDFQILSNTPVRQRMRYELASALRYQTGLNEDRDELRRALQLPAGFNPRARALAQEFRRAADDDRDLVKRVLDLFRSANFRYTMTPPLLGVHSVDEFLFDSRRGFCEHYASSFVFLLRAAGIPARVVTGYQGGELNPMGDYMIVRQSDAHAWAEAWFQGAGWMRIDPTAAVSPLRVDAGIAAAVGPGEPVPFLVRTDYQWLRRVRFAWDNAANGWNQWVLGYGPERQLLLLSRVGMDDATWRTLTLITAAVTGGALAILAGILLIRVRQRAPDPVSRSYQRFCGKLASAGYPRLPYEGPRDYAVRLKLHLPALAHPVEAITGLYAALRYGTLADPDAVGRLRKWVTNFKP